MKIKKKIGGGIGLGGGGGKGGCERRIEVFVKIPKKKLGRRVGGWVGGVLVWGVKVDVNDELKCL